MNKDKTPGKVTPLAPYRKNKEKEKIALVPGETDENSLDELLIHMRRVREAIPVNKQLKEELKLRLAELQASKGETRSQLVTDTAGGIRTESPSQKSGWIARPKYLWFLPAVMLLAAVCWMWCSMTAPKSLEAGPTREIRRFWLEESPLEFACEPQSQGYLVIRNGSLLILDQYGNHTGSVKPPKGQSFASPALSRSGDKLALVRRYDEEGEEIITADLQPAPIEADTAQTLEKALAKAEVILKVGRGKSLSGLAWSPDGKTLAYSLGEPGKQNEVYLLAEGKEPVNLGPGRRPAWSPDGTRLVVERTGESGRPELWLTGPNGEKGIYLAEGERPAWSSRGYLAFITVKTTERVLTYRPDGSPLFSVRQCQDEIRTINLGRKGDILFKKQDGPVLSGDRLLMAPDTRPGVDELNWLRRLELEGVKEPRTLLLSQLNNYQSINFSPDGKTLLVARREGGTVLLLQVGLRERLVKRGEE